MCESLLHMPAIYEFDTTFQSISTLEDYRMASTFSWTSIPLLLLAILCIYTAMYFIISPVETSRYFYTLRESFQSSQMTQPMNRDIPKLSACHCLPGFIPQRQNLSDPYSFYHCIKTSDMKTTRACY
jgi:hypothetical protein